MKVSIVTPSFRASDWLKLCIASVADQQGCPFEHIVQDSCSDDGTQDWLRGDSRVQAFIEKDSGMYDAVNRGIARASGDIVAYLNCDEQYLPGTLSAAAAYFENHPEVDGVISDAVVTDTAGNYVCTRYSLVPRESQMWVRFPVLSCGFFLRTSRLKQSGIVFDTKWRALGDFFWIREMVKANFKFAVLPRVTSVFTDTGENLSLAPNSLRESELKWQMAPRAVKVLNPFFVLQYRLGIAARGSLWQKPFAYALYTLESPSRRVTRRAENPTSFWKSRLRIRPVPGNAAA